MDMQRRGIKVDLAERDFTVRRLGERRDFLQARLDKLAEIFWGRGLNPQSPKQLVEFFYGLMGHKTYINHKTKKPTTDIKALEKIQKTPHLAPFVKLILEIRNVKGLIADLTKKLRKGRMHCRINIAGTETGRFSSAADCFGHGTNMQNQTERVKRVYVPDPGMKLAYIDLEQAESRAVGVTCAALGFGDAYLNACLSEDLHTTVTRLVWPELDWTGEIKHDRSIADLPFYRHFTYRDMSKRGGHGTNYYGSERAIAINLNIEIKVASAFQFNYFGSFPEIREWHDWNRMMLQTTGQIETLMGRVRQFGGRVWDDATIREAIAYGPQSSIADYMNLGLLYVHTYMPEVQLLLQVHDAILIQYPEDREDEIIPEVRRWLETPRLGNSEISISVPTEAETGWNWAHVDPSNRFHSDGNPFGLKKYKGHDDRKFEPTSLLDRRIR